MGSVRGGCDACDTRAVIDRICARETSYKGGDVTSVTGGCAGGVWEWGVRARPAGSALDPLPPPWRAISSLSRTDCTTGHLAQAYRTLVRKSVLGTVPPNVAQAPLGASAYVATEVP